MPFRKLNAIQEAIRGENLGGWLFWNFRHRDRLSDDILELSPGLTNSRHWFYAVPAEGSPVKIVHAIEETHLDTLPGEKISYYSREELNSALKTLGGKSWGAHVSETISILSYLDAGTAAILESAGLQLCSAAPLVQRFKGLLDETGIESHEKAARHLYDIVDECWAMVREAYAAGTVLYEGDIRDAMLRKMDERNIATDHPPVVGTGINSSDSHYDFSGRGAPFKEGDVVQFDLWAKEKTEKAIYADISWVGVFAKNAPAQIEEAFANLVSSREGAYTFIEEELSAGRRPTGAMVDAKTREILIGHGYGSAIKHRTGHGIDTECHGSGVNIDSVEFTDQRLLLDGACFSLEPGIYFSDFGMRTEIDVYIKKGKPIVSGRDRQFRLLTC
ncbi:M24 family metallopeptidase [Breznakiella homolactica]|uniref:M24 family metallopeptidase n=1 Tax=Breznakiella homolactica TaxID=2798577 RepID=A0A7T8BC66_9SPIR|nr:M24 family metallopeptidase [Breznakiella homolactica]QQO11121.1 M24 family metallopeptidase [Breznakiella homolactica]